MAKSSSCMSMVPPLSVSKRLKISCICNFMVLPTFTISIKSKVWWLNMKIIAEQCNYFRQWWSPRSRTASPESPDSSNFTSHVIWIVAVQENVPYRFQVIMDSIPDPAAQWKGQSCVLSCYAGLGAKQVADLACHQNSSRYVVWHRPRRRQPANQEDWTYCCKACKENSRILQDSCLWYDTVQVILAAMEAIYWLDP